MARYADVDKLLEHIKDLPTWWADAGGVYGSSMKYPDGMFDVNDVVNSIDGFEGIIISDDINSIIEAFNIFPTINPVSVDDMQEALKKAEQNYDEGIYQEE
jgi:hypothetical protein